MNAPLHHARALLTACGLSLLIGCAPGSGANGQPGGARRPPPVTVTKGAEKLATTVASTNPPPPTFPVMTPADAVAGRVVSYNPQARFVIVDFLFNALPQPGQQLNVYRDGQKVGVVRCAPWVRAAQMAADVIEGEAGPGDDVRAE